MWSTLASDLRTSSSTSIVQKKQGNPPTAGRSTRTSFTKANSNKIPNSVVKSFHRSLHPFMSCERKSAGLHEVHTKILIVGALLGPSTAYHVFLTPGTKLSALVRKSKIGYRNRLAQIILDLTADAHGRTPPHSREPIHNRGADFPPTNVHRQIMDPVSVGE
ncbi:hypothetical protein CSKR_111076 [Clonorchis sinensis]|uniref:Uncharacterized protein n=1 Tax=Clonorchis sinensis TaxID=79923 RepID=A0A3R7DML4_CLOSI|nr:hypothetical protein CSKR_111076 [Clonorchis sinensis]